MIKLKWMPNFCNLILTLFRFPVKVSVKFNHNSDLTLFHLKISDTGGSGSAWRLPGSGSDRKHNPFFLLFYAKRQTY